MPLALVSSTEAKATGTADIIAEVLGVPVTVHAGLHEHARTAADFRATQAEFELAIRTMLAEPSAVSFGTETADAAHARFDSAVSDVMATHSANVVVVSHGTVIALYVARAAKLDPFALWKRLTLPSSVTLSWPNLVPLSLTEEFR